MKTDVYGFKCFKHFVFSVLFSLLFCVNFKRYVEPELPREEALIHRFAFSIKIYTSGDRPDLIWSRELFC